ncbi:MAG TPA: right-handed parallel beta-helix repeat-containing protein [Thermoanaerobaculia bacterium]|jgi:hypothetical protein|nr:right-handed parallel beta-helix repeat-containing protein [Thermoanaerobaculia bacterium]
MTRILILLFLAATADARSLYVSTKGNDRHDGSLEKPLRTITAAAQKARAGDTVYVRGGIYTQAVEISSKGTARQRIDFRPYGSEKAILDGAKLRRNTPIVSLSRCAYVDFRGFEIRNGRYIGVNLRNAKHVRVIDNNIHDTVRNGIYAGGDVIGANRDITISGNLVHRTVLENKEPSHDGGWAGAVVVSKTEIAAIIGNRVWNNHGEGIIAGRSNHLDVRDNEVFDNFSVEIYLDNARHVTVERNVVYSTGNRRFFRNGKPSAGIMIANEVNRNMNLSSHNTIANNLIVGTRWGFYYGGFEAGGGLRNTIVASNRFYGIVDAVVHIDDDRHAESVIKRNLVVDTDPGDTHSMRGITFRSNRWIRGREGLDAGMREIAAYTR